MKRMFIRLDDACPKMNIANWNRMEILLDKYNIKPIVGIIPDCKDPDMEKYSEDPDFWNIRVPSWQKKGWTLAMHGYQHVFETNEGGINPVNMRSEFAGLTLDRQKEKIKKGHNILNYHNVFPTVFFAPAHTFDDNTLNALYEETPIRVISDTIASNIYYEKRFYFLPQQSGVVRRLPFKIVTFCYHPNNMKPDDFTILDNFLREHKNKFVALHINISQTIKRKRRFDEKILEWLYFKRRALKEIINFRRC